MTKLEYVSPENLRTYHVFVKNHFDGELANKSDITHTHDTATLESSGFMSAEDKTKLDNIDNNFSETISESLKTKADVKHTHNVDDVFGLDDKLSKLNVTIDSFMSSTSVNPVQNKIITASLKNKADVGHTHGVSDISGLDSKLSDLRVTVDTAMSSYSVNPVQNRVVNSALKTKADLNHQHSTSDIPDLDAVLDKKVSTIVVEAAESTIDSFMSSTSVNPVQNKIITASLKNKADVGHTHYIKDVVGLQTTIDSKLDKNLKGVAGGIAELDSEGHVLSSQLPSYVDDVLEYEGINSFPKTGSSGKIYVDIATNDSYRWGGSTYVKIASSLTLGANESTAFRGDLGNVAYNHSQKVGSGEVSDTNPHGLIPSDIEAADKVHSHDDLYYTESEIDGKIEQIQKTEEKSLSGLKIDLKAEIADKADKVHSHDDLYYTESEIDKTVSDLRTNLSGLVSTTRSILETRIADKADKVHSHDDLYYTESEIDAKLNDTKSDIETALSETNEKLAKKIVTSTITLEASKWTEDKEYSLEDKYPVASYDLDLFPISEMSEDAYSAWVQAKCVSSATRNVLLATGKTPEIEILIGIRSVSK